MDIVWLLAVVLFFATSWALVQVVGRLRNGE